MFKWLVSCAILAFLMLEIALRVFLGLGTPPLSIEHPTIEYMFKPNQDIKRFGNRQLFNEYGMRSVSLEVKQNKPITLVIGDSVINGGSQTAHSDLATSILSEDGRFFGNVSAGSWGPENQFAWLREFGHLNADTLVWVLSSHDLLDFPEFGKLNRNTHPTSKPLFATFEFFDRYVWNRYFGQREKHQLTLAADDFHRGLQALRDVANYAQENNLKLCIIKHFTKEELVGEVSSNFEIMNKFFEEIGIPMLADQEHMNDSIAKNVLPYRDDIHLNDVGQFILAKNINQCNQIAQIPIGKIKLGESDSE